MSMKRSHTFLTQVQHVFTASGNVRIKYAVNFVVLQFNFSYRIQFN